MSRNRELEAGLKQIADDYHLPGGGRKKLSQLVAEHLDWFDAAAKRGMRWRDMIGALTAAGVTSKRGKPLSIGTISSAAWRERAERQQDAKARSLQAPRSRPPRPRLRSPAKLAKHGPLGLEVSQGEDVPGGKAVRTSRTSATRMGRAANVDRLVSTKPSASRPKARAHPSKDLLDFMNRARTVRLRSDDE